MASKRIHSHSLVSFVAQLTFRHLNFIVIWKAEDSRFYREFSTKYIFLEKENFPNIHFSKKESFLTIHFLRKWKVFQKYKNENFPKYIFFPEGKLLLLFFNLILFSVILWRFSSFSILLGKIGSFSLFSFISNLVLLLKSWNPLANNIKSNKLK